jgi:2-phospho-L-lactate guanylyltransferase
VDAAILPVKRLDRAKARLEPGFGTSERAAIARALLDDALGLCERAGFLRWWVVTDDASVEDEARGRGLATLADRGEGLNPALAQAIAAVLQAGADSVTVVPTDIPLARAEDLRDVLDTGATSDVVIVPSIDGGTNALHLRPPDVMAPRFGPGSLAAHIEMAERASLRCALLDLPRLAIDIDVVDDVHTFLAQPGSQEGSTGATLRRLRGSAVG